MAGKHNKRDEHVMNEHVMIMIICWHHRDSDECAEEDMALGGWTESSTTRQL